MEVVVAADSLFYKTDDGSYWCKTIYNYDFWMRYTSVFDSVVIISRTKHVPANEIKNYLRVDGPNVRVIELPYMRGMKQYIKSFFKFRNAAKNAVKNANYLIVRLPSVSASMVLDFYKHKNKPYLIEVVADPFDAYKTNKIAQIMYTKKLKKTAMSANGASYVTERYLQTKYPSYAQINGEDKNHFETYYSTIDLKEEYFSNTKRYSTNKESYTIVHTANSINNNIKGHDTLLKVLKKLREKGYNCNVKFIGDGSKRVDYEKYARELGIEDYVNFKGLLSSSHQVREELINSDLFIFPSRAEGLPRAVIEAMAVGLPCLSTPVNGIPELLENEFLFDPDDVEGFTNKIIKLINSPERLNEMSKKNIEKAKEYSWKKLSIRRKQFYKKLLSID